MGLEQAVLGLSIAMFAAQVLAWRWARGIQGHLRGSWGYELARLLAWIMGMSILARLAGIGAIAVLDHNNLDTALTLTLAAQLFGAAIFVGAAIEIWRISRKVDPNSDPPSAEGSHGLESVSVEVDQVGARPTVAVDDPDANAALPGTH